MIDSIEANALAGFPDTQVVRYARHAPRTTVKEEVLNVRIPSSYKRAIEAAAAAAHVPQSVIVREAIGAWLTESDLVNT